MRLWWIGAADNRLAGMAFIAFPILYLLLAWISFVHPMRGVYITPWNPQAALSVALLIWRPSAVWIVWLSAVGGEMLAGGVQAPVVTLASSASSTVGYVAVAWGLRRWIGSHVEVVTRRHLAVFVLVVTSGVLIAGTLRAGALAALGAMSSERLLAAVRRGATGDGVGILVTLPLIAMLADRSRRAATRSMVLSMEWWIVVCVALIAAVVIFVPGGQQQFNAFYLLFVPVVWGASRFGTPGAVWAALVVQLLVLAAVQSPQYLPPTVFELQLLVAVLAATGLLLGATVEEREKAERDLRASLRMAAAGEMAAALAHELNQPLTAVSTYAESSQMLTKRLDPSGAARALADVGSKLVQEAARAADVVKRLRDFFRSGVTELKPVEAGQLVREAVHGQAARARSLGVRLLWSCDLPQSILELDPVQISVVLRNILANALEAASGEPGTSKPEPQVLVRAEHRDGSFMVIVTDTGPGLRGDQVQTVFDRRAFSEKPGGMGIGLSISRSIVQAHGGRMWAEAADGGKFVFSLPLKQGLGS